LTETLVVVAVVAILAVLAYPALEAARNKSRSAKLVANMKTISAAMFLYVSDNNGRHLPLQPPPNTRWCIYLRPYLPRYDVPTTYTSVFHDPLDLVKYNTMFHPYAPNITLNRAIFSRVAASIARPARHLMITTGLRDPALGIRNSDGSSGGVQYVNSNYYRTAAQAALMTRAPGVHYGVFADGHFEMVPQATILAEAAKDINARSLLWDGLRNNASGR
jgi:type II secretory pathway pseudopilin PulG